MSINFVLPLSAPPKEYAIQQFRITLWPGVALPHPGQIEQRRVLRDGLIGPAVRVVGKVSGEARRFVLSTAEEKTLERRVAQTARRLGLHDRGAVIEAGEIYLELKALDLGSEDAIECFANRFGLLGIGSDSYTAVRDLPWYQPEVQKLAETRPQDAEAINPFWGGIRPVSTIESVQEFQFAARVLRDLHTAYRCLIGGAPEEMQWTSTETPPNADDGVVEIQPGVLEIGAPNPEHAIASYFEHTLTAGLQPFKPRVTLSGPDTRNRPAHRWMAGATVPLYATCCLEFYNHLVEHAAFRTCANMTCGRTFVRQHGRAEQGQYRRKGVKYCSSTCARAQAQRQYRARRSN